MATLPGSGPWSVEQLLEAVEHLSPAERREFQRRLAARQAANGTAGPDEATFVQAAQTRLPAAAERRLRKLIARSKRGQLTPEELTDYQSLAREAQRIDAARAEALAELARRRGQSVQAALDPEGRPDGA
jgi:hypothetical protein